MELTGGNLQGVRFFTKSGSLWKMSDTFTQENPCCRIGHFLSHGFCFWPLPPPSPGRVKLHPSGWFFSQLGYLNGNLEMTDLVSLGSTETNVPIPSRSLRSGPHSGPSHICHQCARCRHDTCYGKHQINSLIYTLSEI